MSEIGHYSILISLFLSGYCGLISIIGIKSRRKDMEFSSFITGPRILGKIINTDEDSLQTKSPIEVMRS